MASRIAVITQGILQQIDTPQQLYDFPDNLFVAGFIGSPAMNFFPATLKSGDGNLVVDGGSFNVEVPADRAEPYRSHVDKEVIFGIRPEDIHNPQFTPPEITPQHVECTVDVTELMGNEIFAYLKSGDNVFVARVDPRSKYNVGDQIEVVFNMDNMHIFDKETEERIK